MEQIKVHRPLNWLVDTANGSEKGVNMYLMENQVNSSRIPPRHIWQMFLFHHLTYINGKFCAKNGTGSFTGWAVIRGLVGNRYFLRKFKINQVNSIRNDCVNLTGSF